MSISVFEHKEFDHHEQVVFFHEKKTGLKAIVAVHNTFRGPSLGGCRMWPYASETEALTDVLRLSKGMTYKSAISNLPLGGGKSVIIGDPRQHKTSELLHAMGERLNSLNGRYIIAEDSGTSVADIKTIAEKTPFVSGVDNKLDKQGVLRDGDPSPATAYGVFVGIKSAVRYKLGKEDLQGLKVAIQGLGNVGYRLAEYLHNSGVELLVADIHEENVDKAVNELGAEAVSTNEIMAVHADVLAPCALGAVVNDHTIDSIKASIIAGAANNQLAEPRHGDELSQRNILYAPDYVINAGGIIDVCYERMEDAYDADKVYQHIETIGETLLEIFKRSDKEQQATYKIADEIAEEKFC